MRGTFIPLMGAAAVASGCGFGFADDESGGRDNLPTSGAGPFRRLETNVDTPIEEPWLLSERTLDFTEPALIARDGGGFVFFATRESPEPPAGDTQIWRGAARDLTEVPDEPLAPVLVADQPWEEGRVTGPAIVVLSDRWVMFYEGGPVEAPSIGRAESTDDGRTWVKSTGAVMLGGGAPGAAFDGETWLVAFRGGDAARLESVIVLARSTDGVTFERDPGPLLGPTGIVDSFERVGVTSPSLAWLVEPTGRGHWAMWYGGLEEVPDEGDAPRYAVGYLASFDGLDWSGLAGGRPVLAAPAGAPVVVVDGVRATMLFQANDGQRPAIGIALHP